MESKEFSSHPVLEDNVVNLSNSNASVEEAIVGAKGPLGLGICRQLLDLGEVWLNVLDGVDLPVGVLHRLLHEVLLVVISVMDSLVLRIGEARGGIVEGPSLVARNDALDVVKVFVLNSGDEGVGVVSEGLVGLEAGGDLGAEVLPREAIVDSGLELGGSGRGHRVLFDG